MKRQLLKLGMAIFLAVLFFSNTISAATVSWVGGNGDWSTTNNWSPHQVPGSGDSAVISASGSYTVTVSNNNVQVANLVLGGSAGTQTLSVGAFSLSVGNASVVGTNGILILNSSTLTGSLAGSGAINWTNGGTLSSGSSLTVASNAVLNISGSSTLNLYGVLASAGTVNWAGTATLEVWNSSPNGWTGGIVNQAGAVFNVQSDQTIINWNGTTAYFNNAGLLRKSPTTGATTIGVAFNNTGAVDVESGTVNFNGNGGGTGTFNAAASAGIGFGGNNGGTAFTGAGNYSVSGGTLTLNGAMQNLSVSGGTVNGVNASITNLTWSSGTIQGTNAVIGTASWTGGSIGASSVPTVVTVASNAVLNISGSSTLNLYGVLASAGTVNWAGTATLEVWNSSPNGWTGGIVNQAGAVFNVQSDQTIINWNGTTAYFNNAGLLRKSPTTGATTIGVAFNNTGAVDVESGTVNFNGNGGGTGTFNAAASAGIGFGGNNGGTAFTGAGNYSVSGGTLTLNGAMQNLSVSGGTVNGVNASITNLTWSSGTIQGTNAVIGTASWTGGSIGASSVPTVVTVASNAVLNISGSSTLNLYGVLASAGTVNWAGTATLEVWNSSPNGWTGGIVNQAGAVFNVQSDQTIINWNGTTAYFNNAGLLRKSPTTGATTIGVAFNNTGAVDVESGTVNFNGNGGGTGTFNAAASAGIGFGGNNGGTAFTGAGNYSVSGGTLTLNGAMQNLSVSGGTVNGVNASITNLTWSSGTIQGTNAVIGTASWTGGSIGASSVPTVVTVASNAVLNISGSSTLNLYGVLASAGTVNWAGTATLEVWNSSPNGWTGGIVNQAGAVFNVQSDQTIINWNGTTAYFNNAGLLRKSPTTGATTIGVAFNNTGAVDVESGTVNFNGNGGGTGTFNAAASAGIGFGGNNGGTAFTGAGNYSVSGGTLTLNGAMQNLSVSGGTVNGVNASITNLTWSSGTIQGTNAVIGTASWTGGSIGASSVPTVVTVASNAVLNISGSSTLNLYGVLASAGTVNWAGTATLEVWNSSPNGWTGGIVNQAGAVFNVQSDQTIINWNGTTAYFNNAGLLRKSPTTGATTIGVAFNNTGAVDVESGTVNFNGNGGGTGTFNAAASAGIGFGGNNGGTAFTGAGNYSVSGGTLTLNGAMQNLSVSGGTVNGVNASITNLTWSSGTIQGTNAVIGTASWTGGSIGASSVPTVVTVASNAVLNISGSSTLNLYGVLASAGTVNWAGTATLEVWNSSPNGWTGGIVNQAGAVFNVQSDQTIINWNGTTAYFNNAGLLRKSPTTGATTIGVAFNNTGAVDVESGTIAMQGQYGGSGGVLSFALNGINNYGSISFANPVALASAGTLQAHTGNGYSPTPDDGFPLLTYPSATGNFTNFNLPPQAQWQTIVDPANFIIVAINSQPITNSYTWTGAINSNWSNPNNWNPVGVPSGQLGQAITFSNGTINLATPITINGQFNWLGGTLTGNPLTIASNGALSIGSTNAKVLQNALTNSGIVIWGGGNIVLSNCAANVGTIVNASGGLWALWCDQAMNSSCTNANSYWANSGTIYKSFGAGTTTVGVPFDNYGGTIGLTQGTFALNSSASFNGGSIGGSGTVSFNDGLQNNQALSVNGITLTLGGAWVNAGMINATNAVINLGGTFTLSTLGTINTSGTTENLTGTFNNTGTSLLLGSSVGSWIINGGTIEGGTVTTTNGAALLVGSSGGTLNGVTVNGTLDVGDSYYNGSGVVLTVLNGLTLNGAALVGCPTNSNFGAISFVGSQTLAGNASVTFGEQPNSSYNALSLPNASSTLTIASGITIEGQNGTIGYSSEYGGSQNVSVINNGTISGNVSPGTVNIAAQGYTQQGILSVTSGNVVNVKGSIFLTGLGLFTIQPGGTIQVTGNVSGNTMNSGEFSASGTLVLNGSGTGNAPQFFEVMGQDFGTSGVGFIHNFTYGTIILANNTYVRLINQYQNSSGSGPEALYVNSLVIPSGTTLDLNGFHVYARAFQGGGTMLNGTVTQVPNSGPIGLGAPSLGSLATAGQLDQWTFFARAGQYYTVLVDPGSDTGASPYLNYVQVQVVNTNGAVIASATNSTSGAPVLLSSIAITNDGTYGVQIHAPPLVPGSTGHYNVTVWQTTPNVGSIVLNQIVNGDIETPYSLDQWNFAASAGQQIRFHLVNTSGPGLGFSLIGPNGPLGFTNVTTDSGFVTLTSSGNYSVTVHSLAGQYGIEYAFELYQTIQTNLTFGTTYQGQWAGSGQAVLLQYNLSASSPLQVLLNNLVTNNHAVVYVQLGQPPTPTSYAYSATASGPNQQLLIPVAAAGTWYVLVYGDNIQTPGAYTVTASSYSVFLNSITPNISGLNQPFTITLLGAGFDATSSIQFIDSSNHVYQASSVSVDSFTQLTVTESAGVLQPGMYSVRASLASGSSYTLTNAFTVLTYGIPNLVTSLSLPSAMGYHIPSTIYPSYGNNGGAAMAAPLLVLSANQQGVQGALMTLQSSMVAQGLWTSAEPLGFSHTVQFLGSGQTSGLLQPGESYQVPVYYAGWQQPWNFSYPHFTWNLGVIQTTDTNVVNWSLLESSLQPGDMPADSWNAVFSAFTNEVGTTWGAYVSMLDNNSYYLGRLGLNVTDISKLLSFQLMQADGLCPIRTLASSVDASVPTPGLPLAFSRFFGERISERYAFGSLGRGWSHNWQYSLQQGSDGTVTIFGPGGSQRVFQPNTQSGGYWAQVGDYGTLASAGSGAFTLTEKSGLLYYFAANGTLSYVQDLNGNTITLGYSGGLLTSLTHSSGQYIHIAYNGAGLVQTLTDNFGHQTILSYDGANQHLTGTQYFDGRTASYTYNTTGTVEQLHALTGAASSCCNWRYFNYDVYGRLINTYVGNNEESLTFAYGANLVFQPLIGNGAVLPFSGGEITVSDDVTNATQFYFDNNGLLAKAVDALGNAVHLSFDGNYNLTSITDPAGRSYNYSYDGKGNVTQTTDPLGNNSQFTYTAIYDRLASVTDARGNATAYSYDPYGNLQNITHADRSVESWTYDNFGNPETWSNRRDHQTFYTVNNNGQVTGKYFADGSATLYSYDAKANLTNTTTFDIYLNPLTSVGMAYDASNHLTQITYPGGKYLSFAYDSVGRRISSMDQLGHTLLYYYDDAGRLESMTNELNALVVSYQYDATGRVAVKTLGGGMFTTYQYDAAGELLNLTNFLENGMALSRFNYIYDGRGRRATMGTQDGNWTYGYDDLGQLLTAVYVPLTTNVPAQNLAYVYDAVGNRTASIENGVTHSYSANNLNEYFSVGQTNYTFDADGNLIKEASPAGTNNYTYNDENRLISMTSPQGTWASSYDGLEDRVGETVNGTNSQYVIDPIGLGNVVGEYDGNGDLIAHFDHSLGLLTRIDASANSYGYTFDGIGNVQQLVSGSGVVTNNYAYAPFGNILQNVTGAVTPFQFGGQFGVMTETSGSDFMRNRFYQPGVGSFASADPLGLDGGDINFYRYAQNAPTFLVDPEGEDWRIDLRLGIFAVNYIAQKQLLQFGVANQSVINEVNALIPKVFSTSTGVPLIPSGNPLGTIVGRSFFYYQVAKVGFDFANDINLPSTVNNWLYNYYYNYFLSQNQWPTPPTQPGGGGTTITVGTEDPNQLIGPGGYGANGFVVASNLLAYRINFENSSNAAAPAQQVNIVDQLTTNYDWTTFNVSEVGFGNVIISLPPGVAYLATNVPYSYLGTNFQVQIQIGIQPNTGEVYANFQSINPATSLPPPVNIGFLPPENGTGIGMGHVTYTIRAKGGLANGTQLQNVALISFNQQPSIATDQIDDENPAAGINPSLEATITLDSIPPTSYVLPLPAQSQLLQVPVSWRGQDNTNGPGVASFNVYVSDNGGAWTMWQFATTATNATFQGQPHHTYGFTSQAIDNAGLVEPQHTTADATTLIVANPLFQFTVTPASTNLNSTATFSYTITVKNIGSLNLSNVVMSNSMPAGISLDYVEYGRGSCDIEDTYLLWSLGNMNTNVSASMSVTADTAENGIWTNSFVVADSQGAASANAVELLYIGVTPPVFLSIALTNNQVQLSWPANAGNFGLQMATNLVPQTSWAAVTNNSITNGSQVNVTLPLTGTNRFFRLQSH